MWPSRNRKDVPEGILPHSGRRRDDVKSSTAGRSYNFLIRKVQKLSLAPFVSTYPFSVHHITNLRTNGDPVFNSTMTDSSKESPWAMPSCNNISRNDNRPYSLSKPPDVHRASFPAPSPHRRDELITQLFIEPMQIQMTLHSATIIG
jgi:hypothetical protein